MPIVLERVFALADPATEGCGGHCRAPFSLTSSRARRLGRAWHLAPVGVGCRGFTGPVPSASLDASGAAARRSGLSIEPQARARVTAPSEADETSAAYLAKTPSDSAAAAGSSSRRRAASSSSESSTESVRASTSSTIVSPSRSAASGPPRAASGRDVADHQAVRRAREAAVGDQRDLVAEPLADERARSRAASRASRARRRGPRSGSRPRRRARSAAP